MLNIVNYFISELQSSVLDHVMFPSNSETLFCWLLYALKQLSYPSMLMCMYAGQVKSIFTKSMKFTISFVCIS